MSPAHGVVQLVQLELWSLLHSLMPIWNCVMVQLGGVEIRGLRPEVVAEGDEVLVHYRSRTNVRRRLSTEILAQVDRRAREHL